MGKVFRNNEVPKWIFENFDLLDRNLIEVIEHANITMDKGASHIMTMVTLSELPDEMDDLSVLADVLICSQFDNLLDISLDTFPKQKKISFEDLGDIVDFIVLV